MYLLLGAPKGENPHFTYIYSCLQRLNEWALLRTAVINQRPIKSFIISSLGRIWCAGEKLTGRGNMLAGCSDSRGKSYMLMIVWRSSLSILMFARRIVASAALHKRVNLSAAASHVVGILHTLTLKIKKTYTLSNSKVSWKNNENKCFQNFASYFKLESELYICCVYITKWIYASMTDRIRWTKNC